MIENEKKIIMLICACTVGTNLKTIEEELYEYESYCAPELLEDLRKTRDQITMFLDVLSVDSSEKYRKFVEGIG